MTISLENISKRYNYEWIFRKISVEFVHGNSYAILGPNGSGKSTLLQILAGALSHSGGKIRYRLNDKEISNENIFLQIAIAAPYLELVEELTLTEFLQFHRQFKPFLPGITIPQIIRSVELEKAAHKQIRYFSSGMKQRAKLAQAIFSDVPVILLDEPCSNLDADGVKLYQQLVQDHCMERLTIISSNDEQEYGMCGEKIQMMDYK
ncbi:MAG TPA: ATP-binding cassette domain-containing protein [Chitinophagaceae bacterium]